MSKCNSSKCVDAKIISTLTKQQRDNNCKNDTEILQTENQISCLGMPKSPSQSLAPPNRKVIIEQNMANIFQRGIWMSAKQKIFFIEGV
jgi:hypothetical protein